MFKNLITTILMAVLCTIITACGFDGDPEGDNLGSLDLVGNKAFKTACSQTEDLVDPEHTKDSVDTGNGTHTAKFEKILAGTWFCTSTPVDTSFSPVKTQSIVKYGKPTVEKITFTSSSTVGPDKCKAVFTAKASGTPLQGVSIKHTSGVFCTTDSAGTCPLAGLDCGEVSFAAHKEGYVDMSQTTKLEKDKDNNISFDMELIPPAKTCAFTGNISESGVGALAGANVFEGNNAICTAVSNASGVCTGTLSAGTHSLVAKLSGYNDSSAASVTCTNGVAVTQAFTLTKISTDTGEIVATITLQGRTDHSGTLVEAGGKNCSTNSSGVCTVFDVPVGSNVEVKATHSDFVTQTKSVTVGANASVPVSMTLVPVPPNSGWIDATCMEGTSPLSGATVTAGSFTCVTDSTGKCSVAVPAGSYSVTCSKTGYTTSAGQSVTVNPGQHTTVPPITIAKVPPTGTGAVTFKCYEYGSSPKKALPGCKITQINAGVALGLTCTGNDPYGVCQIAGLPFDTELRFEIALTGYTTANWPSSGTAQKVILTAGSPLQIHESYLVKNP